MGGRTFEVIVIGAGPAGEVLLRRAEALAEARRVPGAAQAITGELERAGGLGAATSSSAVSTTPGRSRGWSRGPRAS
jgi:hypothetical protein